jgi:hypothetical protein
MAVEEVNKEAVDYLCDLLLTRIAGRGKHVSNHRDITGDYKVDTVEIIKREDQERFLQLSLSAFNAECGTYFGLGDVEFCKHFAALIVGYAASVALASQSLVERGREYTQTDNGVTLDPPKIAQIAWEQSIAERNWWERAIRSLRDETGFYDEWVKEDE